MVHKSQDAQTLISPVVARWKRGLRYFPIPCFCSINGQTNNNSGCRIPFWVTTWQPAGGISQQTEAYGHFRGKSSEHVESPQQLWTIQTQITATQQQLHSFLTTLDWHRSQTGRRHQAASHSKSLKSPCLKLRGQGSGTYLNIQQGQFHLIHPAFYTVLSIEIYHLIYVILYSIRIFSVFSLRALHQE